MKILRLIIVGLVLLMVGIWFGRGFETGSEKADSDYQISRIYDIPVPLSQFTLTDHNGKEFNKWSLNRKWTFMFFGYIFCPDVCPTALVDLNDVYQDLVEKGDLIEKQFRVDTQVVFVTVDPERDTVDELKDYVPHFNKAFIGVTGNPDVIDSIARPMGVAYSTVPGRDSDGDYFIDHSASFMLIDPLGRLRASFPPPHNPEKVTEEFRRIRSEYTEECCRANLKFTYIKLGDDEDEEEEDEEDAQERDQ
jgi:protein SCO1/2